MAAAKAGTHKAAAPRRSTAECAALERRLLADSEANPTDNGFAAMQRIRAMHRELTSQGCQPGSGGPDFGPARAAMGEPPPGSGRLHTSYDAPNGNPNQGTNFEAGRPMVDVSTRRTP